MKPEKINSTVTLPNLLDDFIQRFKKGGTIHIKKSHKGRFTKYCNGKVTSECISKGKNSPDSSVRKMATFALNAKSWKK